MPSEPDWPPPLETGAEKGKELIFQAKIEYLKELAKAKQAEDLERLKNEEAQRLAELQGKITAEKGKQDADAANIAATAGAINASVAAFHAGLIEVSKAAIDRARAGADTVQKAAAAIAGVYTTILALAFSVSEHPLPSRGVVPTILLGWAIVWSTAYLAYLSKSKQVRQPEPTTSFETGAMRRSIAFIKWTRSGAMNRKFALRVSVFGLAFGLALLPAPFVNFDPASNDTPAVATEPAWPVKPAGATEIDKILYQAEVTEVTELRAKSKPIADDGDDSTWWWLCGGALALSLIIPGIFAGIDHRKHDDEEDETGAVPGPTLRQ
jgi:hypothetical protein